ncbi:MAG: DUF2284 domain-containing protein [Nanoarchaeota archaeon]|nr:DUF2284 domain-containing protein [Nanoarchaeota archaeon]
MEDQQILDICKKDTVIAAKLFSADKIEIADWPILKCAFGCDSYGKNWTCPPHNDITPEKARKIIKDYKRAILLQFDSTDYKKIYNILLSIEKEILNNNFYKVFALSMGYCPLCDKCTVPNPCAFPELRRPPMEALGIDVFKTLKNIGIELKILKKGEKYTPYCIILLD